MNRQWLWFYVHIHCILYVCVYICICVFMGCGHVYICIHVCVFIFALRNLTELDTGNYICSSLSHIYHLNVTGEYLEPLCVV